MSLPVKRKFQQCERHLWDIRDVPELTGIKGMFLLLFELGRPRFVPNCAGQFGRTAELDAPKDAPVGKGPWMDRVTSGI